MDDIKMNLDLERFAQLDLDSSSSSDHRDDSLLENENGDDMMWVRMDTPAFDTGKEDRRGRAITLAMSSRPQRVVSLETLGDEGRDDDGDYLFISAASDAPMQHGVAAATDPLVAHLAPSTTTTTALNPKLLIKRTSSLDDNSSATTTYSDPHSKGGRIREHASLSGQKHAHEDDIDNAVPLITPPSPPKRRKLQ